MSEDNKRKTIYDIARVMNVSPTTVYRALNNKGRINTNTRDQILKKAEEMGYRTNLAASSMSRKAFRVGIVFDLYFPGFHDEIIKAMREAFDQLYDFRVEGVFAPLDAVYNKKVQLEKLKELASFSDALIFAPWNSDSEYVEFIENCADRGIPVFTCLNDIPGSRRIGTVRHNTQLVGDMGAHLLSILGGAGKSVLFVSNKDIMNQNELMEGFTARLKASGNLPLGVYETQNDDHMGYYLTDKILQEHPDLNGIFIGISQSMGVCRCIIERGLVGKVKIICVDIYSQMLEMLRSDVVQATIYQQNKEIGQAIVTNTFNYLTQQKIESEVFYSRPQIIIKSNCEGWI